MLNNYFVFFLLTTLFSTAVCYLRPIRLLIRICNITTSNLYPTYSDATYIYLLADYLSPPRWFRLQYWELWIIKINRDLKRKLNCSPSYLNTIIVIYPIDKRYQKFCDYILNNLRRFAFLSSNMGWVWH
jgi:hypothetical protein